MATTGKGRSPLRFGIIGASGYAGVLIDTLEPFVGRGEVELAAAVVRSPAKIPERAESLRRSGCRLYSDWEVMVESEAGALDLLIVPTGIQSHRPMAERALGLGHRVFLEKPVAATIEDALAVAEAVERSGGRAVLGYQDLSRSSAWWVKRRVGEGAIGEVRAIRGVGLWPRGEDYYARNSWAGSLKAGEEWVLDSPVNNAFAHFLNLMLFWAAADGRSCADCERVEAELYRSRPIESFDTASLRARTADGPVIEFHCTHSCREYADPVLRIEGTRGHIEWDHGRRVRLESGGETEVLPMESGVEGREQCFAQTIRWMRGEEARVCTVAQGLGQTLCVNALHRPGIPIRDREGAPVEVPDWGRLPALEGVEAAMRKAFEGGGLLSENGVAWAAEPGVATIPEDWRRETRRRIERSLAAEATAKPE